MTERSRPFLVALVVGVFLLSAWPSMASGAEAGTAKRAEDMSSAAASRAQGPMTHRRLQSVVVPSICRLPRARLQHGVHPNSRTFPQAGPAAAILGYGQFDYGQQGTRIGDLNGDHVADGLIVMACVFDTQSNYSYEHVFAYRANGTFMGRIQISRNIPPSWAQYSVDLDRTGIRNQLIRVRVRHYRDDDAHCCPSLTSNLQFRWVNGRFRIVR